MSTEKRGRSTIMPDSSAAKVVEAPGGGFDVLHDVTDKVLGHKESRNDAELLSLKIQDRNQVDLSQSERSKLDKAKKNDTVPSG